ncbi:APC family permease [Arthrobacter crystallopoietes]|uniref:APC family permease n=1 Tax=Crystallibacter crystallopoietes TaxID=37928 RepID=UPI001ABEE6CA|nr:APC family permease [Arthrobacter crystallopoietes]QTG82069.1 APC family permease [Arthrobacter crystallopoietes]
MTVPTTNTQQDALSTNSLGVFGVAFLVLAAVAPLTGIVVVTAIGIALGNGGGMVASFIAVTAILLLFGTGYARMSSELVNAGGFYAFVLKGLGRPAALVTGLIAMIGYNFFVAGAVGTIGFFAQIVIAQLTGFDLHWYLWAIISVVAAFALSRKGIGFSAKVLGVALVCEVLILLVFDFAVLFTHGFDLGVFKPEIAFTGAVGIGFLFAANAFVGVEATGLFSEEARDPKRTIPRATFTAIGFIGVFAAFTTWAIVSATGAAQAQTTALDHLEAGDLVFSLSSTYLGTTLTTMMMALLLVSLFAALMALHNSATRYIYSLSRAGILTRSLSRTRANGVPERASIVQFIFATAVAGLFALAGLDPIISLVPSMTGFGTLGIITLQLLAALAIVVHFRRTRDPRMFSTFVAPGIGLLGLTVIVVLAIINFPTLAGSDAPVIAALPLLLLAALAGGLLHAAYLRRKRPDVYEGLNHDLERFDETEHAQTTSR